MLRRRLAVPLLLLLAVVGIGAAVYAQLETGDRGILPLETAEHAGDRRNPCRRRRPGRAIGARLPAGAWRSARASARCGRRCTMRPIGQAPNLPDGDARPDRQLDQRRARADRAEPLHCRPRASSSTAPRSAPFLGIGGQQVTEHSVPMLLIPVHGRPAAPRPASSCATPGSAPGRSSAPLRRRSTMSASSGMGADPLLVNAAQTRRPGRGWWRALLDMYSAQDILVAEVQLQRAYPGGPARARFIARHGPDDEIIGGFTLTAREQRRRSRDDGARRAADGRDLRPGARRGPADARSFAQPAARRRLSSCRAERRGAEARGQSRTPSRCRSPAMTSSSTISPWRTCGRCPASRRRRRSRSTRGARATSSSLTAAASVSSRQRSTARGWTVGSSAARWSGFARRPTSRRRFPRLRRLRLRRPSRLPAAAAPPTNQTGTTE